MDHFYNGSKILAKDGLLFTDRAFLLGDSVFTSLIWNNGAFEFLDRHLERINQSIKFLWPELSELGIIDDIKKCLSNIEKEICCKRYYFRITLIPVSENNGLKVKYKSVDYLISYYESQCLQHHANICISKSKRTESILPSFIKNTSYLESIQELREAEGLGFNDVLFLSDKGVVTEASTSNIFWYKDNNIYTPRAHNNMFLSGITRSVVIDSLKKSDFKLMESDFFIEDIIKSDGIFLTNAVKGIVFVDKFNSTCFENSSTNSTIVKILDVFERYKTNYGK